MSSYDTDLDAPTAVTVRCQDDRAVSVRLCAPSRPDEDRVLYTVEASTPGLAARLDAVVSWNQGMGPAPFLEALATDFRGWDGRRVRQTDNRDLTVSAVFRSGGHVGLTRTLHPWRSAAVVGRHPSRPGSTPASSCPPSRSMSDASSHSRTATTAVLRHVRTLNGHGWDDRGVAGG